MALGLRSLTRQQVDLPHGEMFGRDEQSDQKRPLPTLHVQLPQDVTRSDGMNGSAGRFFSRGLRPAPQPAVAGIARVREFEVGLSARVRAGGPLRRWRREELEHPQWFGAVVERVMPGVPPEKRGLTG